VFVGLQRIEVSRFDGPFPLFISSYGKTEERSCAFDGTAVLGFKHDFCLIAWRRSAVRLLS